ncbi:MAG: hypothetical protein JSS66_10330 [Armatimonadetes bacterium]|nr:hypothetical protein [Armatimonadota bacterium]
MKKSRHTLLAAVRSATLLTEQATAGVIPSSVAVAKVDKVGKSIAARQSKLRSFLDTRRVNARVSEKARDLTQLLDQCQLQLVALSNQLRRSKKGIAFDTAPNYLGTPREFGADLPKSQAAAHPTHLDGSSAEIVRPYMHIVFQHGPRTEVGTNGCQIEDVLNAVIDHLEQFESGPLGCEENRTALSHLHLAVSSLIERRARRENQGVLGTMDPHESSSIPAPAATS